MFIEGERYKFKIINEEYDNNEFFWTIRAICRKTRRYSGINNLNPILSELKVDFEKDRRFEDSCLWEASRKEINIFNKIAKSLVTDKRYLQYLEDKLDEDRSYGEWKNVEL